MSIMLKPCLDCSVLAVGSRCPPCQRKRDRLASAQGRAKRGNNWTRVSARLRQRWRDQGFGCADAHLGNCKGKIQADHLGNTSTYQPRCAYHNNLKH